MQEKFEEPKVRLACLCADGRIPGETACVKCKERWAADLLEKTELE